MTSCRSTSGSTPRSRPPARARRRAQSALTLTLTRTRTLNLTLTLTVACSSRRGLPPLQRSHPLARGCSLGAGRRGPAAQLPKGGCGGAASLRSNPGFTAPAHPLQARTRPSCHSTPTWRAPATRRSGRSAASGTRAGRRGISTSPGRRISRRSARKRRAGSRSERRAPRELWARRARRQCARPQRAQGCTGTHALTRKRERGCFY